MNEKIQHIIQEIRTKKDALKQSVDTQTQKANQLEQELKQLKSDLSKKNEQITHLETEYSQLQSLKSILEQDHVQLKSLLEETKNQVVNSANAVAPTGVNNEQIDELVREIEYCIGQLKHNA